MANVILGGLASSNTDYNLVKASQELTREVLQQDLFKQLLGMGVINTSGENILSKQGGDTVNFYNRFRIDAKGGVGDRDLYAAAKDSEFGKRSLVINETNESFRAKKKRTMTSQRTKSSFGLPSDGLMEQMKDWAMRLFTANLVIQAAGNNATSTTVSALASTAFTTTDELAVIRAHNTPPAATSQFSAIGNLGAGGVTTPNNITSSNIVTVQDFMKIEEIISQEYAGITQWGYNKMLSNGYRGVVLICKTQWNQMLNAAKAIGANAVISEAMYASMASNDPARYTGKTIGQYKTYECPFTPDLLYVVVPDSVLPRSVHSNAEVANTRTAIVLGYDAIDWAVGSMVAGSREAMFLIDQDNQHEKLNSYDYFALYIQNGMKKAQLNGFGANSSNFYDLGTFVLNGYSRN